MNGTGGITMKCQKCQVREASILIRQSLNGSEKEYALCQDCMMELGFANSFGLDFDNFMETGSLSPKLFSSFSANTQNLAGAYNSGVFVPGKKEVRICRNCNTTLDEIRKKGRLGCSECYETFEEQLGQVFRRIQSGDRHRGRRIAESKEKSECDKLHERNEKLQAKIQEAVEKEDYESAAIFKTQILKNKETMANLEKPGDPQPDPKKDPQRNPGAKTAKRPGAAGNAAKGTKPKLPADKSGEKDKKPDNKENKPDNREGEDAL